MLSRFVLIFALLAVCSATSCLTTKAIVVRPGDQLDSVSLAESAFAVMAGFSRQHGLIQRSPAKLGLMNDLLVCFVQDDQNSIELCGKTKRGEAHFMLRYVMASQLIPHADSLRSALLNTLRITFGEQSVRECEWEFQRRAAETGC
jgi:hypothetical protein